MGDNDELVGSMIIGDKEIVLGGSRKAKSRHRL